MIARNDPTPEPKKQPILELLEDRTYQRRTMATLKRAIREDWPMTPEVRALVLQRIQEILENKSNEESARDVIAAAKVFIAADAINTKREAMDQAEEHKGQPDLHVHAHASVDRKALLQDPNYLEYLRERALPAPPQQKTEGN